MKMCVKIKKKKQQEKRKKQKKKQKQNQTKSKKKVEGKNGSVRKHTFIQISQFTTRFGNMLTMIMQIIE